MKYIINQEMEFLEIDDKNLVVYNPENGETHYINKTGKTILALLGDGKEEVELIDLVCVDFSGSKERISSDIRDYLDELAGKRVIVLL